MLNVDKRVWGGWGGEVGLSGLQCRTELGHCRLLICTPGTSMQTVVESRSAGPFFAEPGRFEWCRSPAAGMCSEYSLHR